MSIETNWQTARPSVRERVKFLFNNDRLSDVKFVVRNGDGKSESTQVIPAHRFILAMGSPVFEAMFYGELAEKSDTIELPDCDYDSLLELFRYMYSDGVNLSGSNVMGVLYLAKKYIVPSLADKCTEYLKEKIDPSNVFDILSFAQKYEEKALEDRCWKVIESQTEAAVTSEGFEKIQKSVLKQVVVSRDSGDQRSLLVSSCRSMGNQTMRKARFGSRWSNEKTSSRRRGGKGDTLPGYEGRGVCCYRR